MSRYLHTAVPWMTRIHRPRMESETVNIFIDIENVPRERVGFIELNAVDRA